MNSSWFIFHNHGRLFTSEFRFKNSSWNSSLIHSFIDTVCNVIWSIWHLPQINFLLYFCFCCCLCFSFTLFHLFFIFFFLHKTNIIKQTNKQNAFFRLYWQMNEIYLKSFFFFFYIFCLILLFIESQQILSKQLQWRIHKNTHIQEYEIIFQIKNRRKKIDNDNNNNNEK